MSIVADILRTYRAPGEVIRTRVGAVAREDRALAVLIGACCVAFVAQWPRLAREASIQPEVGLNALLAGALFGFIMVLPLAFYLFSLVLIAFEKLTKSGVSGYAIRMALFWSFLASTPLLLFAGLVAGFIGPGPALGIFGTLPWVAFITFYVAGRGSLSPKEAGA